MNESPSTHDALVTELEDLRQRLRQYEQSPSDPPPLVPTSEPLDRALGIARWAYDVQEDRLRFSPGADTLFDRHAIEEIRTIAQFATLLPEGARRSFLASIQEALNEGTAFDLEWIYYRHDRDRRIIHSHVTPATVGNHAVKQLLALHQDITDYRRDTEMVRESERRLQLAMEASNEGLWDWNLATGRQYWDPRIYTMLSFRPNEFPASFDTLENLLHPTDRDPTIRRIEEHIAAKRASFRDEFRLQTKDGDYRWILRKGRVAERDPNGRPLRMIGTHVDITERKQAEQALRESNEQMISVLESISDGFFALDRDMVVTYFNAPAARLLDRAREEVVGRHLFREAFPEAAGSVFETRYREALQTGEPANFEVYFGQPPLENWYDVRVYPFREGIAVYFQITTDRHRIEEARQANEKQLREAHALLESLNDSIRDLIFYKDSQGRYLGCNQAFAEHVGRAKPNVIGATDQDLYPPDEAAYFVQSDQQILTEGRPQRFEAQIRHPDGSVLIVDTMKTPLRNPEGQIVGLIGVARDITERRARDEERLQHLAYLEHMHHIDRLLREAPDLEAMIRQAIEAIRGIFDADRAYLVHPCDPHGPTWSVPVEATKPEYPGASQEKSSFAITPDIARDFERALNANEPVAYDPASGVPLASFTAQRQTRSKLAMAIDPKIGQPWIIGLQQCAYDRVWTDQEKALFRDIGHRLAGALGRLLLNRELQESREMFSAFMDQLPGDACIFDQNGMLLYANEHLRARLGERNVIGQAMSAALSSEIAKPILADARSALAGHPVDRVLQWRQATGSTRSIKIHTFAIQRGPRPPLLGAIGIDVTERIRAEAQLQELNEQLEDRVAQRTAELEAVNRELEAFCYSISHDLRAPLRAMDGFAQALAEEAGPQLDEVGAEYLSRIRHASRRMSGLIEDLLRLSRVSQAELTPQRVDLSRLAGDVAHELRQRDPDRQVTFTIADDLIAYGDARLFRVLLENLIGNAWKFTGHREQAHIEVGRTTRHHQPHFFIRDDGAGFDITFVDKLFVAFQRLHPAGQFEGHGIGLAIAQRIINRHGGAIQAEAQVDRGATFYFTLPTRPHDDEE